MNKLYTKTRKPIIRCLVEGESIRATARTADVSRNTVAKLLVDAGKACAAHQDRALRDLPCKRIQVDEIWSFIYAKEKNIARARFARSLQKTQFKLIHYPAPKGLDSGAMEHYMNE